MITLQPMNIVQAAADILWSRVLPEFPDVRFALSEGGIGWIPYFLERVDYVYKHHQAWTGQDLPMLPSELFRERFVTCFIDDAAGVKNRHDVGIDTITWECDYPHSDSTWPDSPELLGTHARWRARRRDRQDDARERDAVLQLRPLRPRPEGRGHRRCPSSAGDRRRHVSAVVGQGVRAADVADQDHRPRGAGGEGCTGRAAGLNGVGLNCVDPTSPTFTQVAARS